MKLEPRDYAEARRAYCKSHEAFAALAYLRHRGSDSEALPLVLQKDFLRLRGAELRMRIWAFNFGMNIASSEQQAKRGAFKYCVARFDAVLQQWKRAPQR